MGFHWHSSLSLPLWYSFTPKIRMPTLETSDEELNLQELPELELPEDLDSVVKLVDEDVPMLKLLMLRLPQPPQMTKQQPRKVKKEQKEKRFPHGVTLPTPWVPG